MIWTTEKHFVLIRLKRPIYVHFSSLIPNISTLVLYIALLTISTFPVFIVLTFQVRILWFAKAQFSIVGYGALNDHNSLGLWCSHIISTSPTSFNILLFPSSRLSAFKPEGLTILHYRFPSFGSDHGAIWHHPKRWSCYVRWTRHYERAKTFSRQNISRIFPGCVPTLCRTSTE